jgi:hypothetical protein
MRSLASLDKSLGLCFSDEGVKEMTGPCIPQSPPRSPLPLEPSQTLARSKPCAMAKGGGRWFHPSRNYHEASGSGGRMLFRAYAPMAEWPPRPPHSEQLLYIEVEMAR